jgi:hypothetical protein
MIVAVYWPRGDFRIIELSTVLTLGNLCRGVLIWMMVSEIEMSPEYRTVIRSIMMDSEDG